MPAESRKVQQQQLKILIIEDDDDQRELMRETLEDHFGAGTVVGAESGNHALGQDLSSFDLILSDYNLPDRTGMDLLDQIRSRCTTPVIMVTGENVGQIAVEAIRRGATDYIVKFGDYLFTIPLVVEKNLTVAKVKRENESLRSELERALQEVRDKNAQLEQSLKKVEEVAATDPLTGLYNRRHFGRVSEQLWSEAHRYDQDLACVMIDLDGYKQLNDRYGHQVGDQVLVVAGKIITANLRRMDVAARYGGDEFILLLPHATAEEAAGVAGRIRDEYRNAVASLLRRNETATMSIGIGSRRGDEPTHVDQLVAAADAALYRAKAAGRNRIIISVPEKSAAPV
jgi:two-component system cell cycle response regulator